MNKSVGDAERIPVSDDYLRAIGRAAYNFAYLEWGIVWLNERLSPGFLRTVHLLTAGEIFRAFEASVQSVPPDDPDKDALKRLAEKFGQLVKDRNRLMHGNPFTADSGEQRLSYNGKHGRKDWTQRQIMDFASRIGSASIEAGRILRGGRYEQWRNSRSKIPESVSLRRQSFQ